MYSEIPPEIETRFLEGVDWSSVVAYSQASAQSRAASHFTIGLRVNKALEPFILREHRDEFWQLLGSGEGGVTGSIPFWVTETAPTWSPRDLNTVVRHGSGDALRAFLRSWGCTERNLEARVPLVRAAAANYRPILSYEIPSRFTDLVWTFQTPRGQRITVTETQDASVVRHILGAYHSIQTMLLTRSLLISFHPHDAVNRRAIYRAGGPLEVSPETRSDLKKRLAAMSLVAAKGAVKYGNCGLLCIGLLRRVRGGRGIGIARWSATGALSALEKDAYHSFGHPKYSYGWTWATCQSTECDFYHFPRDIKVEGPPPALCITGTNPKLDLLRQKQYALMNCSPGFAFMYEGLLFATSFAKAIVVPVPLDYGITSYATADDLRVYFWIQAAIAPMPLVSPPTDTVGGVTCIHPLSWRAALPNGMTLLIFMSTVKTTAPVNLAAIPRDSGLRLAHGDVLLMVESEGKVVSPRQHAEMCQTTFQRWWDHSGGHGIGFPT